MNAISGFVKSSGEIEVFGGRIDRMAAYRRARRDGPRVPERAELQRPHGSGDGDGRARSAPAIAPAPCAHRAAAVSDDGAQEAQAGRRDHRVPRPRSLRRHVAHRAVDGDAPHRGAQLPDRARRAAHPARRADRGRRAEGDRGVRAADQHDPARAGVVDPDHRARHADGDVDQRPDLLPRSRRRHRGGHARHGAQRPQGDRVVPRHRRTRIQRSGARSTVMPDEARAAPTPEPEPEPST